METAKTESTKKKVVKPAEPELTKEEKMLLAFSDATKEIMFTHGLYEGCNKMIGIIFNEISRKYNDMDASIMEVAGALEFARAAILKTREAHKTEPKPIKE